MSRFLLLVVAVLLLPALAGNAAAAEHPEHPSKNAQRLLTTLKAVGIDDPNIKELINTADAHIDHGYLGLAERNASGGKLMLRYELGAVAMRRLELVYIPNDSHFQVTARSNSVMVGYHLTFP